jgi:hypothetical protein
MNDLINKRNCVFDANEEGEWFGRCDESTRGPLASGLSAITGVLKGLTGFNFTRWDSDRYYRHQFGFLHLIHEASHFSDTMGTKDWRYFMNKCLTLGAENPDQTLDNADSIAGYVIYAA